MSRSHWEQNLLRMQTDLADYVHANNVPRKNVQRAADLSQKIFLAHSTADESFSDICRSGYLLSPNALASLPGRSAKPDSVERQLGTADYVFCYAGPFAYPDTGCGFLFNVALETEYRDHSNVAPFDSGGLIRHFVRAIPGEPAVDFLRRHEMPAPEHREYLRESFEYLFAAPDDYVRSINPAWPGPIGLSGGDRRRWTHEVRFPNRISLRNHLRAVFLPISRIADEPIAELLTWCEATDVDYIPFNACRDDDFEKLLGACVDYIERASI